MKVAQKKPSTVKVPVYVTNSQYEIWYAEPVSLGRINKRGLNWYTEDGMRFVSSRDAMEYLIRMRHKALGTTPPVPVIEKKPLPPAPVHKVERRQLTATPMPKKEQEVVQDQLHPRFQEFLDFIDYQARKKGGIQLTGK